MAERDRDVVEFGDLTPEIREFLWAAPEVENGTHDIDDCMTVPDLYTAALEMARQLGFVARYGPPPRIRKTG